MKTVNTLLVIAIVSLVLGCGKSRSESTAWITLSSTGEEVWCESGHVAKDTRSNDARVYWHQDSPGAWQSVPCEVVIIEGRVVTQCRISVGDSYSTRFQCFVRNGNWLEKACHTNSDVDMDVDESYELVPDGQGGHLCQID